MDAKTLSLAVAPRFPGKWKQVLDEAIPAFVKERFSPSPNWKDKPFSKDDVNFFSKGLIELSDFFTVEREGGSLPNYFTTARFRSSYFLYFFGLQGAKFLTLFDRYPEAVQAALNHAQKTGVLRVIDVGSGPGTASLAFLCLILDEVITGNPKSAKLPFAIELVWIDHNATILKDGEALLQKILALFPEVDGSIELKTEARSWWKHPKGFSFEASLVLFGNVLNECPNDPRIFQTGLAPFLTSAAGGGVLLVEPAFRDASQRIAQIRDEVLASDHPLPLWGPCLHEGRCPLTTGRNWCHFSVPAELPGAFFRKFSIKLGGIREWLKFSFVWFGAPKKAPLRKGIKEWVRVISDPMRTPKGLQNLICRPERYSYQPAGKRPVYRGEVIRDPLLQSTHPRTRN